jgi:hypothetical protein
MIKCLLWLILTDVCGPAASLHWPQVEHLLDNLWTTIQGITLQAQLLGIGI